MFILYINNLYLVYGLLRFIKIADDTNIWCLCDDPIVLVDTLINEHSKLEARFKINKLSLNASKANYKMFGN